MKLLLKISGYIARDMRTAKYQLHDIYFAFIAPFKSHTLHPGKLLSTNLIPFIARPL